MYARYRGNPLLNIIKSIRNLFHKIPNLFYVDGPKGTTKAEFLKLIWHSTIISNHVYWLLVCHDKRFSPTEHP